MTVLRYFRRNEGLRVDDTHSEQGLQRVDIFTMSLANDTTMVNRHENVIFPSCSPSTLKAAHPENTGPDCWPLVISRHHIKMNE
jgi:hypothetical protein